MPHQTYDLNRSHAALDMDSTLVVVVEMSQSTWMSHAVLPGSERRPVKKLPADEGKLLAQLHRWRDDAEKATGHAVPRICVAYEAGRDGFWLARWMLSEEAGFGKPYRIQSLLGRSSWSADALCDLVRRYALDALCDSTGVLVVDETGFLKKGAHSVGVARQYSGTAGRIENCQIGVFAAYASRWGHTLIDRQLYLPKTWAADPDRRAKAHVPQEVGFATKPQMAREMVSRFSTKAFPVHLFWPMLYMGPTAGSDAC